jgi:hypothetical protein
MLTDDTLSKIVNVLYSTLQTLKVDRCSKISDKSVRLILQKCRQLREFSAMFCTQLTDFAFDCLQIPNKDDNRM